ncbi:DEKNAAC102365 [Brettanomyces naardenensis]|uniref:Ribonucleoside-diphosphate reductase n=1 Tax=Brettanomyces naardenensis TaxID=13370 RepID=A0A448YLE6_BRENA|nr:DEKNAAC102365 [Brettanomyces naardenensis]
MTTIHYQYSHLAARILERYLQKKIPVRYSDNVEILRSYAPNKKHAYKRLVSERLYNVVLKHREEIDSHIVAERDFDIDYFGFRTLEKSYLLKIDGMCHETPQFLLMRVALSLHDDNLIKAFESYDLMSRKYFLHASPTLFNAGTEFPNLSSCFLVSLEDDSLDGIFRTVHKCAMISKAAGGIGMHLSNVRAAGTYISGTNGESSGIVPMLRVFNSTAQYVDQGGNKRPGAICAYLEPWHADIMEFLDLKKNHGKEEMRARDLFYALWIPDLFMKRVENDEVWSLFSEDTCPGLSDCWGKSFEQLYCKYESRGSYIRQVRARKVWEKILISQTETGTPFLLYKDACNSKSNQQNLGTIKSSNLCCEVVEYSSKDEIAVCNLASLGLPSYVERASDGRPTFNLRKLHSVTKVLVHNLNRVIDVGAYPLKECEVSNMKHRPIAVGVQGLADAFFEMKLPFGSRESRRLNLEIFQTIYHGALEASMELAMKEGPYESYEGSPISSGILQYDMWPGIQPKETESLWDWKGLKEKIHSYGLRNSLLVALMPTASTSQILGFTECFEPITSNVYTRRVLSGEHQVVNHYLVDDLIEKGLWNREIKDQIVAANGSIQDISSIPQFMKDMYRTVWEISQRVIIDMAADRAPYIDQSQSLNLYLRTCSMSKLTSMHFYAWKKGLKTGMYYLRTQAASQAIKFTISPSMERRAVPLCSIGVDQCDSCSG